MKKRSFIRGKRTAFTATLFGVMLNFTLFILFALIFAFFISKSRDPLAFSGYTALPLLIVSGALGGFFTSKFRAEGGVGSALASSLILSVIMILTGLFLGGGKIGAIVALNLSVYVLSALVFASLAKRKRKRRR